MWEDKALVIRGLKKRRAHDSHPQKKRDGMVKIRRLVEKKKKKKLV